MNIFNLSRKLVVLSCFLGLAIGEDRSGATEKSVGGYELRVAATGKSADETVAPVETSDVFRNVIVAPGTTISLDSTVDYSLANTVAVTIQCAISNSADTSLGASGLILLARWMTPKVS